MQAIGWRDENGILTTKNQAYMLDGWYVPNDVMMQPKTWNEYFRA